MDPSDDITLDNNCKTYTRFFSAEQLDGVVAADPRQEPDRVRPDEALQ